MSQVLFKINNIELTQFIFEQVKLVGYSRIDDLPCYQLIKTDNNANFFNYMLRLKDKKYMRMLKLNKLLNIQEEVINRQEIETIAFFEKNSNDITIIETQINNGLWI